MGIRIVPEEVFLLEPDRGSDSPALIFHRPPRNTLQDIRKLVMEYFQAISENENRDAERIVRINEITEKLASAALDWLVGWKNFTAGFIAKRYVVRVYRDNEPFADHEEVPFSKDIASHIFSVSDAFSTDLVVAVVQILGNRKAARLMAKELGAYFEYGEEGEGQEGA